MLVQEYVVYSPTSCRCSCGNCIVMPSAQECVCCREVYEVVSKTSSAGVDCIILHPGFETVCLDVWVLQTAYYSYRQHYGENAVEGAMNE